MGADLYIESITEAAAAQYKPKFDRAIKDRNLSQTDEKRESYQAIADAYWALMYPDQGYFRDSYNNSNLAVHLGFSWWQNISKLLDKEGRMQILNIAIFREMVSTGIQNMKSLDKDALLDMSMTVDDNENSVENWNNSFRKRAEQLLKFLDTALEMDEAILCSI